MRVVICGAGEVGYGIAERLAQEDNDVSVIDTSPALVRRIQERLDVRGHVGHGSSPDVLDRAGAEEADMIVAVTKHDEVNMVACQVAHSLFSVPTKIARIREQSYCRAHWRNLFSRENMPIDVIISPEVEVGEVVLRRIALPGARDVVRFSEERIAMVAIKCHEDCPLIEVPLSSLSGSFPDLTATVAGLWRDGEMIMPRSSESIRKDDLAYVIVGADQIRRTLGVFGQDRKEASRIVIAGGGNIGLYVAQAIEERMPSAKLVMLERSREAAVELSDHLERAVVLHGDALDEAILLEAGIQSADLMVSVTNDDQVNVLASVLADKLGCGSNLALLNRAGYRRFAESLGIADYVNPRGVTISRILQYVRRGRIRGVYSLHNGAAEIIEAEALDTSPLLGKPLRELDLPDGVRIGAIDRGGKVVRPLGDTEIRNHDRIVILARSDQVPQVEQMFRVSLEFF